MGGLKSVTKGFSSAWKSVLQPVEKGFKSAWKTVLQPVENGVSNALNPITGVQSMKKAQREADAASAAEADNPVITAEATASAPTNTTVDETADEETNSRKRRRVSLTSTGSKGLTRRLGGTSLLG